MTYPNPQPPNQSRSPHPGGMTEEERAQRKNLNLLGIGLVGAVALVSIVLTALDSPVDPKFTAPVLSAMLIAAAGSFGQAFRIKRDAKRRG
ncbi:hypothetical protein LO763_01400 [Glycomyces sp. A-F 0318]|uniref:hypothetical protein n=1 Tax=Glycomyces amatae TaxID=2881355 RepID=UPI001E45472B|nr:hypothetical protein [Glycomyces amatae]MCD0442280.1 hypothetical protein [Glycomyces amatae]